MVIDTSAVLAILFNEPDAEHFESALEADPTRLMSAASLLETAIVVEARLGEPGSRELAQSAGAGISIDGDHVAGFSKICTNSTARLRSRLETRSLISP